jgi:hypothetical protein
MRSIQQGAPRGAGSRSGIGCSFVVVVRTSSPLRRATAGELIGHAGAVVTVDEVRALAAGLERSYEAVVRGRLKLRVGSIVYAAFSEDEWLMGFGFPKEERAALVAGEPEKFQMPRQSDLRFSWVVVRLAAIDHDEMTELVLDAWRMVVPKKVWRAYALAHDLPL